MSRLKLAKTKWKNPVLTGGGLNRLVGFRNTITDFLGDSP